ncbi:prephenate dehydrogenase [Pararobbsia silviterrae]|uniref:prephenate dehydrogenase n=1 Tax=Pararobbsia silviterrae TaxID=1792498 RepID=A0A494YB92_9BURK|nr:prephenate dehydrogenase/arogenate dehydrogenase family protein [Pararobbsia silviterrae]RKP59445.1 prephenate dehydrogenase/arogenate dehydrogenase family protein [Pararobbsia silviterrae]
MSDRPFAFRKIVICGVGLIGGSLALALRRAGCVPAGAEIVGVGRSRASVERAVELGVVSSACTFDDVAGLAHALDGADIVLLAVPVAQTGALLDVMLPHLQRQTIVTDAGSTKRDVIAAARASLGSRIDQFVPAHPIAGRERSGVEAAIDSLYDGRNVVLCPLPENRAEDVARVDAMWRATGARTHRMTPDQHDTVFASVSHLPHLLSFALVDQILDSGEADLKFAFAAGGFRDFTRIAASSPEMWRDIFVANKQAVLAELDGYTAVLARLRAAIERGDGETLLTTFARARDARSQWSDRPAQEPSRQSLREAAIASGMTVQAILTLRERMRGGAGSDTSTDASTGSASRDDSAPE